MAAGRFITFEGGEGSGKSTQVRLLADRLRARGLDVLVTREPGGSPFAEQVRALILDPEIAPHSALSEALLFYAARADLLAGIIRPALAGGRWVICDRFADSSRVYQGTAGGLSDATLDALDRLVVAPTRPDLTLILDLAPKVGLARAHARRTTAAGSDQGLADPFEGRTLEFHERLRAGYQAIARAEPARCALIDASSSPDAVADQVWAEVQRRLPASGS